LLLTKAHEELCKKDPWDKSCITNTKDDCAWEGIGCNVDICYDHQTATVLAEPAEEENDTEWFDYKIS
jgi:hypothetical protein